MTLQRLIDIRPTRTMVLSFGAVLLLFPGLIKTFFEQTLGVAVVVASLGALFVTGRDGLRLDLVGRGQKGRVFIATFLWFLGYLVLSNVWAYVAGFDQFSMQKTIEVLGLTGSSFVLGAAFGRDLDSSETLFESFLILALAYVLGTLLLFRGESLFSLVNKVTVNYLTMARFLGIALLLALCDVLLRRRIRVLTVLVILSTVGLLAVIGARGPVVAVAVALVPVCIWTFVLDPGARHLSAKPLLALGVVLAASMLVVASFGGELRLFKRMDLLSSSYLGSSAEQRLAFYHAAWAMFAESPAIGQGIGSWPVFYGLSSYLYPHGLLPEVLAETGVVGLLLLATPLAFVGCCLRRRLSRGELAPLVVPGVLFLFALANSMVSGDLSRNRFLFFFYALFGAVALRLIDGRDEIERRTPS